MNIVYLIGNGFDLNLGLKTSYNDFFEWYNALEGSKKTKDVINFIRFATEKQKIDDKWADLELALGAYTVEFKSDDIVEEAKELKRNLTDAIATFIEEQEDSIKVTNDLSDIFMNSLSEPETIASLRKTEKNTIFAEKNRFPKKNTWYANVISFNYSRTFEKTINFENKPIRIGMHYQQGKSSEIILQNIEHIHGYAEERLVLGVDNPDQVLNTSLHNTSAMNHYVKTQHNSKIGLAHERKCIDWINLSNLIYVYGLSLGETDQKWKDLVIQCLARHQSILFLFIHEPNKTFKRNRDLDIDEYLEKLKKDFLNITNLNLKEEQIEEICKRIYIFHNAPVFKIPVEEKTLDTSII